MVAIGIAFFFCLVATVVHSTNYIPASYGGINTLLNCRDDPLVLPLQPRGPNEIWRPAYNRYSMQTIILHILSNFISGDPWQLVNSFILTLLYSMDT